MVEKQELNRQAIADGLLLPDSLDERDDFSYKLGQELTPHQYRCYKIIHELSFNGSVNTQKLLQEIFGIDSAETFDGDSFRKLWKLARDIREKLGKESLITVWGSGYLSRRAVIEMAVKKNAESVPPAGIGPTSYP